MLKIQKNEKYSGIGLVELIIALGVAGIALTVLMTMSANSMREAIRYERQDALTRLAGSGALVVRRHVEVANDPRETVSFGGPVNRCYEINLENERVFFGTPYSMDSDSLKGESDLEIDIIYDEENDFGDLYYFAYCIDSIEESPGLSVDTYIGHVEAGFVDCSNCGVQPYQHSIIVSTLDN